MTAELFLVLEAEGAMIGGDDGERPFFERVPQRLLMTLFAQWRSEDKFRLLPAFARHLVFDGENQVLRAGFGEGARPALLHKLQVIECVLVGEMNYVDGCTSHISKSDRAMRGFSFGLR